MLNPTCAVDTCSRPARSKKADYCQSHYMRFWKYGDATNLPGRWLGADLRGATFGLLYVIGRVPQATHRNRTRWLCRCKCGNETLVTATALTRGMSKSCGDPVHKRIAVVTYNGWHNRVRTDLGLASEYPCFDCGGAADHWSYNHLDPEELESDHGPYSVDLNYYEPRCCSCHSRFDQAYKKGFLSPVPRNLGDPTKMATVTATSLVDDLDGEHVADAVVTFSVEGHSYEIDLTNANRQKLYEALEPYMVAGRKLRQENAKPARAGRQPARTDPAQLAAIRAWAADAGHAVKARGRIPARVVEAFEAAHQEATA